MQLIQKLRDDKKCMKKVEPSSRSKAIEDIINIGSFVEALVLNHYVLVRKILAEIKSLDTQECLNGGVSVLVTGFLTGKDNVV
ncbi:hypothetical protein Tco_0786391 [Tanacetum coccineum]